MVEQERKPEWTFFQIYGKNFSRVPYRTGRYIEIYVIIIFVTIDVVVVAKVGLICKTICF